MSNSTRKKKKKKNKQTRQQRRQLVCVALSNIDFYFQSINYSFVYFLFHALEEGGGGRKLFIELR